MSEIIIKADYAGVLRQLNPEASRSCRRAVICMFVRPAHAHEHGAPY